MKKLRELLKSQSGKFAIVAVSVVCVLFGVLAVRSFLSAGLPAAMLDATYICTETGKTFHHRLEPGEAIPVLSPFSGKNTGVRAEACYWTPEGTTKPEPTWVLLNEQIGQSGPTFCPDCGRLVVARNPMPGQDAKPPPTQEEYASRHPSSGAKAAADMPR